MTLEQLVPALDLCRQLKAAGFPQDTALRWSMQHEPHIPDVEPAWMPIAFNEPILCAAPTAEEILKELPLFLNKVIHEQLCVTREENTPACNGWLVGWWSMDIHGVLGGVGKKSLSEVAAQTYLWWKKEVAG